MEKKKAAFGGCALMSGAGLAAGGAGLVAVIAVAVAVPTVLLPRALAMVEAELRAQLDAEIALGDASITLYSSFPNLEVGFSDLVITNHAPFEGTELARIGSATASIHVMSLLGAGPILIEGITLDNAAFSVLTDAEGHTNTDILVSADEAAGAEAAATEPPTLKLGDVRIDGLSLRYDDRQSDMLVEVSGLSHRSSGDFSSKVVALDTQTDMASLTVVQGGTTLLREARIGADVEVTYDQGSGKVTFGDNNVAINALALAFQGSITPVGDDLDLDVTFGTSQTDFKTLLSLVPGAYVAGYEDVKVTGSLGLSGSAKGRYAAVGDHLPGFTLDVDVADGTLKYPDLPGAVTGIALDLLVEHPEGPMDLVVVDLKRFHLVVAGSPFGGRVKLSRPLSDPKVDMAVEGVLDLDALSKAFPLEEGSASGKLQTDLKLAGAMSDFEAQRVNAITAEGTFRATGMKLTSSSVPMPVMVDKLDMTLSPDKIEVRESKITYQSADSRPSDLRASGTIDNLLPYLLADGVLRGNLKASSNHLDLRPFQGDDEEATAAGESEDVVVPVPTNLDLVTQADFGRVLMDDMTFEEVSGAVTVKDGAVTMEKVTAATLGGQVTMTGKYIAPTAQHADIDFDITGIRFEVKRTMDTFTTLKRIAPILEDALGRFDTGFSLKTRIARDGTPEYSGLLSSGSFTTRQVEVEPDSLDGVSKTLNGKKYKKLDLDNSKVGYSIKGNKLELAPFDAKLGGLPAKAHGSVDIEKLTVDLGIDLDVPTAALSGTDLLGSFGKAVPKKLPVVITLKGPYGKPRLGVEVKGGKKLVGAVEDEVKDVASDLADDALAEARKLADRIVAEAKAAAAKVRAEGKKAADTIRSTANKKARDIEKEGKGNPIKQKAADVAADKVRKEADKKAKDVERESDKAADKIESEAQTRADKVMADARAKANAATR